jgi:methionyl-tRNA formyltransferase
MQAKGLRVVFMGTPEIAAFALKAISEAGFRLAGAVTAPDRPAGRGLKLQPSAVKLAAQELGLPVLQPEKLRDDTFLSSLRKLEADVFVVLAFRMLPEAVWAMPQKGTFNLHASLLPQYRGAAPINWAIVNGEKETGVTTFFINSEIDTGDIIFSSKVAIAEKDNAGSLHDKLMQAGAELICKTLRAIESGTVATVPQLCPQELKPAPKIAKETCRINWQMPAGSISDFIRGFSPYPAAHTVFCRGSEMLPCKIFSAETAETNKLAPGQIDTSKSELLKIGTGLGDLIITELQIAGKKRMQASALLRGGNIAGYTAAL